MGLVLSLLLLVTGSSEAQFLSRDFRSLWKNEVFENYGKIGYRDYVLEMENRRFDFLGDPLIDGVDVVNISEVRRDAPGRKGSYQFRSNLYNQFFQQLIIANEGYGRWSTRLIIGDAIRTFFTPMTLNLSRFNGIRWDGYSSKSQFSVIGAQVSEPPELSGNVEYVERRLSFATGFLGGHWESRIGDVLTIGTTYVNLHRFDTEASRRVNSLRGVVPGVVKGGLRVVYVFFTEDAAEEGGTDARLYDLKMFADGRPVPPIRVGRIDRLVEQVNVTTDQTANIHLRPMEVVHLRRNRGWLKAVVEASNRPFFASVLDEVTVEVPPASLGSPIRLDGTDVAFYEFSVPDSVHDLRFSAVVSGDYSIDLVGGINVSTFGTGEKDLFYDWHNVLRAPGRPSGGSNLRRVTFRYGLPTGLTVLGFNFEANILGFHLKGEYARSLSFFQYPDLGGRRHERDASMFYINCFKSLHPMIDLGLEWFNVPSTYTTEFPIWTSTGAGPTVSGKRYIPFMLVEDNDDLDDWPDKLEHNDPLVPYPTSQGVGYGVFPGLDLNKDGILDTNVDRADPFDEGPDAYQAFLCYYSEPADLSYGDDFNNNGVPDARENDNLPDYLYPADRRGMHIFTVLHPGEHTRLRIGAYRIRRPVGGGRSYAGYAELRYRRTWKGLGYVSFNHRIKRVKDDIPNPVYSSEPFRGSYNLGYALRLDRLEYRNSWDNLSYLETGVQAVPGLNVYNIILYDRNLLRGSPKDDPDLVPGGLITHFAMINKIDYTFHLGPLRITPQVKHIFDRKKLPGQKLPEYQSRWTIPIVRLELQIGPNTFFKAGVQGFPFFPERFRDPANPEGGFNRTTWLAYIQNTSKHRGYNLSVLFGCYRTFVDYVTTARPSYGRVRYFLRMYIG